MKEQNNMGCGCGCDEGIDRRSFLATCGASAGALTFRAVSAADPAPAAASKKEKARVRVAFLYPPSKTFSDNPDGWWSWPGLDFDAEGRQKKYMGAMKSMADRLDVDLAMDAGAVGNARDGERLIQALKNDAPDGLVLIMFYNRSLALADKILAAAEEAGIPAVFYIGLGVKHGPIQKYRRPGLYFIQALEDMDAMAYGLRMISTRKRMSQTTLLSITEAPAKREGVEPFFGVRVRVIPFAEYASMFREIPIDDKAKAFIRQVSAGAREIRKISKKAFENAARAHFAIKALLKWENADGLTMNCLKRGMLKPCVSFAHLNGELIPATCENDFPAMYTQLLGQLLTGRPGFQHNPCYNTEKNLYFASHCTCPSKLYGPEGKSLPYMLRPFLHSNEGSCAIQVFWKAGDPVTMMRYYPGKEPALDVYAGEAVTSHPIPPAGGCTTNVEIKITDRDDACQVKGHHNLLFCGDYARKFRLFAQLYRMGLKE